MGQSAAGAAAGIAGMGLTFMGTVAKGQGEQAGDNAQAARLDRQAEYGRAAATETDAQLRENLNGVLAASTRCARRPALTRRPRPRRHCAAGPDTSPIAHAPFRWAISMRRPRRTKPTQASFGSPVRSPSATREPRRGLACCRVRRRCWRVAFPAAEMEAPSTSAASLGGSPGGSG